LEFGVIHAINAKEEVIGQMNVMVAMEIFEGSKVRML
jgi:hypothetical protein